MNTELSGLLPANLTVHAAENLSGIQVEDTSYGVLDADVIAKKIALSDDYTLVSHYEESYKKGYGEGYAIVRDDYSTYYLVGTEGVIRSFDGEAPVLNLIKETSIDYPYASVIDKAGNALIYGQFDIKYYSNSPIYLGQSGAVSFVKDENIYLYDFTACTGYVSDTTLESITEDDLFGAYSSY